MIGWFCWCHIVRSNACHMLRLVTFLCQVLCHALVMHMSCALLVNHQVLVPVMLYVIRLSCVCQMLVRYSPCLRHVFWQTLVTGFICFFNTCFCHAVPAFMSCIRCMLLALHGVAFYWWTFLSCFALSILYLVHWSFCCTISVRYSVLSFNIWYSWTMCTILIVFNCKSFNCRFIFSWVMLG